MVNNYVKLDQCDPHMINDLLRVISAYLYYLEGERSWFHEEYQKAFKTILDGAKKPSVSATKIIVDNQYPEMYRLRHVMEGAYGVVDAMRTNISYSKAERRLSNNQT